MENPRSLRSRLLTGAAALIMVPVLYALSSGPAAYLATWNDVLIPPVEKLYLPLILAADRASLLPLLERYVNWWEALHSK